MILCLHMHTRTAPGSYLTGFLLACKEVCHSVTVHGEMLEIELYLNSASPPLQATGYISLHSERLTPRTHHLSSAQGHKEKGTDRIELPLCSWPDFQPQDAAAASFSAHHQPSL
jgi:hypothetical protein